MSSFLYIHLHISWKTLKPMKHLYDMYEKMGEVKKTAIGNSTRKLMYRYTITSYGTRNS